MAKPMTRAELHAAARRRERKILARCKCCTQAEIRAIYERCPPGYEIDHKVPLAIGGKHCLQNLQILSDIEHNTKTANDNRDIAALRQVWAATGIDF
jgi:5-methylcytosine-specific restriction endonuclease McrA